MLDYKVNIKDSLLGKNGEIFVRKELQNLGYTIIAQSFTCNKGEIDIVAFDNNVEERKYKGYTRRQELVFIDVCFKQVIKLGEVCKVKNEKKKQKHLVSASKYFINRYGLDTYPIRFDKVYVVQYDDSYSLEQIKNCKESKL